MRATTLVVVLAAGLSLAACGTPVVAASPSTAPVTRAVEGASTSKVRSGEAITYPDGLVVTVSGWRTEEGPGTGGRVMAVDVTATNPTGSVLRTTPAGVNVRVGNAEDKLRERLVGDSLDAVLQPGEETTATYYYELPAEGGTYSASLEWLQAPDPQDRPVVHVELAP